jgi:hypothetical protein
MSAVGTMVNELVSGAELLAFVGQEAELVLALFAAKNAGATSDVLLAAIRSATLAASDAIMRDELKPPGGP